MERSSFLQADQIAAPAAARDTDVRLLVQAAQGGDTAAFDEIYRRYRQLVHGLLLARVSAADADDLVQDVFLQAWRRLATLKDPGALGGWLAVLARHRAIDHWRSRPDTEPLADNRGSHHLPEDHLRATRALEAIRALPEAYREPLLLRLVEGMTGPEIADRTGLTPGSVRVNLCRGMKLLRARLDHGGPDV